MAWQRVRELGIGCGSAQPADGTRLDYPIAVERAADGTTLIVDRLGIEKSLPFWMEYRTLRVAPDGRVVYDSQAHGIRDGYGCLLGDGGIALLRTSVWEVQLLSAQGRPLRTIDLAAIAKQPPILMSATARDTLLIAFVDRLFEVEIAEVGLDGTLRWLLQPSSHRLGCPGSLHGLADGRVLLTDEFCSIAAEVGRDGSVAWQFGVAKDPSRRPDRLSNPHGARPMPDGRRLVADTRNHRLLAVGDDGVAEPIEPQDTTLNCPTAALPLPGGGVLVADAGHARVVELDARGRVAWQFGGNGIGQHLFSFPRSVEWLGPDDVLVADTANDRVVRLREGRVEPWPMAGEAQLFWPRCARRTPAGTLLVADGRNSRVVELSAHGEVLHELCRIDLEGGLALADPHDVRQLADGTLLLTDASLDLVAVVRWSGEVLWAAGRGLGPRLRDPHSAQPLADGAVLVCDTGNSRVLHLDRDARVVAAVDALHDGPVRYRFNRPRHAERDAHGWLVVDTGNNRILGADRDGGNAWELARLPESPIPWINQPRWACRVDAQELLVTDHLHHRVLHLRRTA